MLKNDTYHPFHALLLVTAKCLSSFKVYFFFPLIRLSFRVLFLQVKWKLIGDHTPSSHVAQRGPKEKHHQQTKYLNEKDRAVTLTSRTARLLPSSREVLLHTVTSGLSVEQT